DRLQQLGHTHVVEIRVVLTRDGKIGMILLPLPLDGKDDIVSVHIAGRLEVGVRMPLHPLAQIEGIDRTVGRNVPALGKAGNDFRRAALEVYNAAIDLAVGIERRSGRVDGRIEVLWTSFGTKYEGLSLRHAAYE